MERWPHQKYAVHEVLKSIGSHNRILLTSPTGMGKSTIVCDLIDRVLDEKWYCVLYSNRKMLIEQLSRTLDKAGIDFGVRASGWSKENAHWPVQISSLPTERQRVIKSEVWDIHGVGRKCLAIIDEAHVNAGGTAQEIVQRHISAGHKVLGVTATPLDLGHMYDHLIQAGTVSAGRACGALVPAHHFGCGEPDLKFIKKHFEGFEITEKQAIKAIMTPGIFGRVTTWFQKLNPNNRPSILFAPGVGESLWFAEQFESIGISAAHIDGDTVWIKGETHKSSPEMRDKILAMSKSGEVTVVCNRFVMREGIDMPWLEHGIFATVFGSLQSYLQSAGRLIRAHPGVESVTIQDHGGNWHRHGSINADRTWRLSDTASRLHAERIDNMRQRKEKEPFNCPKCGQILSRPKCPCGHEVDPRKKSRHVYMQDGTVKEYTGDVYKPRRVSQDPSMIKVWEKMYFRSRSAKGRRTFRQAEALFAYENNNVWPDRNWPFMPIDPADMFKYCDDVPRERLR